MKVVMEIILRLCDYDPDCYCDCCGNWFIVEIPMPYQAGDTLCP